MKDENETPGLSISLSGFKSIVDEQRVEIRPLTVLAGANSSGKSSIMQPLLLMKQTLEAQYDPGVFLLDGPNVRFTSADQILSKIPGKREVDEFVVGFDYDVSFKISYRKSGFGLEIGDITLSDDGEKYTIKPGMTFREVIQIIPRNARMVINIVRNIALEARQVFRLKICPDRCFLSIKSKEANTSSIKSFTKILTGSVSEVIQKTIHIPGLRGNPSRTYKKAAYGKMFPGIFPDYSASIIHHWHNQDKEKINMLEKNLQKLGLTWKIRAKEVDATQFEVRVGRMPESYGNETNDLVNIANVGFGVSQCLPVLVALLTADKGQIVYIEQPELHLHPRAQVTLAEIIADAAKRGVLVVVETHSQYLLLGIQTLVANGKLDNELIKLHWFNRKENGATEISSVDLDKNGAYGDWPEDFSDVELKLENDYIDAFEKSLGLRDN